MSLSEKLAYLKRRDKRTTEDAFAYTGIPMGTLNKIFSGQTHSPSSQALELLCRFFHVSTQYVLDDNVPVECCLSVWSGLEDALPVSAAELDLIVRYRRLFPQDRYSINSILRLYALRLSTRPSAEAVRLLPCYSSAWMGRAGALTDALRVRLIEVPVTAITRDADCAVTVTSNELCPFFRPGDILAVKNQACAEHRLGVFVLNGEALIRKLYRRQDEVMLAPLTKGIPCICVAPGDSFDCAGEVIGQIRTYYNWEE